MSKIERKIKNFLAAVGIAAGSFTPDASMFQKDINQAALDAMRNDKAGSPTLVVDNPYNIQLSPDQQYAPEQYQNLGTFVELPSVRNLTSQEQQGIHALLAERFQHQDIPQEGRFLVPFTLDLSTQTIEGFPPISQNSDLARHFEQTRNLAEDVSSFGGESTLLLAVEKGSNGDITQAALFLQPTNDFQFGEVSFSQDYQSFIVAQEDGTPVWFQTNDLPQGASLDLITSPFDIQTIAEHARLNGYDIDATAYQGGFVVVARDRQGKVVRVFTKEGALTFQRTYLTHTGGDAVNIRDIPSTSGNRVGSFTPQSEPLPTVTPQQFQELGVQVPDPSRLTITDTSVAYNDGRYTWIAVFTNNGQILWIAQFPQVETHTQIEGVSIAQERALRGRELFSNDPQTLARQLELPETNTYSFFEQDVYGTITMLQDQTGTIWAVTETGQNNWQTAEMLRDTLGLETHAQIPRESQPEELHYFFTRDHWNVFLEEARPNGNTRGISAIFDPRENRWINLEGVRQQMVELNLFRGMSFDGLGYSNAAEKYFSFDGISFGIYDVDIAIPIGNQTFRITKMLQVLWLDDPGSRVPWTFENMRLRSTMVALIIVNPDGQEIRTNHYDDQDEYLNTWGTFIRGYINVDTRSEWRYDEPFRTIWDSIGNRWGDWRTYQNAINDFYEQYGVLPIDIRVYYEAQRGDDGQYDGYLVNFPSR